MSKVVVYGPQGCGKTRNAEALMRCYGCQHLLDEWDGATPIPPGTLALTSIMPPYGAEADIVVPFERMPTTA